MKVFSIHQESTAVGLYRIINPMHWLNKSKKAEVHRLNFVSNKANLPLPIEYYFHETEWSDIMFFQRVDNSENLALLLSLHEALKKPLIIDVDDYVFDVKSDNPAYQYYNPTNTQHQQYAATLINQATAIVVTNKYLKDYYSAFNDNIYIIPNCIDFSLFEWPRKKRARLRIGWTGAQAHDFDLKEIEDVIPKILKDYPQVDFVTFGYQPAWTKKLPKSRYKHYHWVSLYQYFNTCAEIGIDIGLAPLTDSKWNRGKSNLRWLEYSALKTPTIASNVAPYRDSIKDGKTGLIVKNKEDWYKHIARLIEDKTLREKIGTAAYLEVKRNYNIMNMRFKYLKIFKEVLKKYKQFNT